MKSKKILGFPEYITITFYIAFLTLPFLSFGGSNIADGFHCTFVTFPTNYLLYIAPAAMYFFLKKSDIEENDKTLYILLFDAVTVVTMYRAIQTNRGTVFFTFIATIIFCVILLNTNNMLANILLFSVLLVFKAPLSYIFASYIPVLLLIMIYSFGKKEEKEKKSNFLLYTYLYMPVLIVILYIAKKIQIYNHSSFLNLSNIHNKVEIIAGMLIPIICSALFTVRALPVIKNGKFTEKLSIILFAVYPVAISVINCFFIITTSEPMHTFLLAVIMFIMGNILLSVIYGEKVNRIIPQKLNNTACIILMMAIFCTFTFK